MALIFIGSSLCSICRSVLQETHDLVSWPAFLNEGQKFWEYSDSGMHRACFESWENKEEFEELFRLRPDVDFDAPWLREQIKEYGMPAWLKEIREYRESKTGK